DVGVGLEHVADVHRGLDEHYAERRGERGDEDAGAHAPIAQPGERRLPRALQRRLRGDRGHACTSAASMYAAISSALCLGWSATMRPSPRNSTRSAWLAAIASC